MESLIYVYPAFILGLVVGAVTWRRNWQSLWVYGLGTATFIALVAHQSTVPLICPADAEECTPAPALFWALLALVNVGAWMLGAALGAAVAESKQGRPRSDRP